MATSSEGGMATSSGGQPAQGGSTASGGASAPSGGASQTHSSATGGSAPITGGVAATGGTRASTSATGGIAATGGTTNHTTTSATGGMTSAATTTSNSATGGVLATGGKASGGASNTGGIVSVGGVTSTGAAPSGGATAASGGVSNTGGANNTGGSSSLCSWSQGPSATNGATTCYWFGQGTAKPNDDYACKGNYKTYCGYCGTETGSKPASTGQNWCPINDIADAVPNISTTHFVAMPSNPLGQGKNCGACVEVTYQGVSIIATVIDECPSCASDQDLDLNLSAAKALGMNELMGKIDNGVHWRIVACPTTTPIMVNFNGNSASTYLSQVYFENLEFPIASATSGSNKATLNGGFWDFGKDMKGQTVTLTDVMGHTVTGTVPSSGAGSLGVQFSATCN